jgi:hypothetical protein
MKSASATDLDRNSGERSGGTCCFPPHTRDLVFHLASRAVLAAGHPAAQQ